MKIGLAQINTTVGDFTGNAGKIMDAYTQLVKAGAELVVFPELTVTGYPPRDLLFKTRFVADNRATLDRIAAEVGSVPALIGFVDVNTERTGRPFFNAAVWCEGGAVAHVAHKCLLPTYDVFDEDRYFQPAATPTVVDFKGVRVGVTICEDFWNDPSLFPDQRYDRDPIEYLAGEELNLLVNLSASPWHRGKGNFRAELVKHAANRCNCTAVYCNAVGGNDELIFDGHSIVAEPNGVILGGLAAFAEDLVVIDTGDPEEQVIDETFRQEDMKDVHDALVLGTRDYAHKCGFKRALIGLSGGIDSAVTAAIAVEALGAENIIGVSLPSAISSQHSRDDASRLAENLGIAYHSVPVERIVDGATETLAPVFSGRTADVTEENIQARSRGLVLMAMSNKFGALLLTTGNKSELSVGYCTLYGDMCGGLAVISDVPKMAVYELARWINRDREIIPVNTIDKPPSAELRPDQKDEDSLPPYEILDEILRLYVEEGKSRGEIAEAGFDLDVVNDIVRKVDLNEYKRKQAAPGLKITPLAFGVGRRIPIVQRYVG